MTLEVRCIDTDSLVSITSRLLTKEKTHMKRKRSMLLGSILGIMVAISTMGLIRTAKADCTCACTYDCSNSSCYAEFSGNSAADCLKCVSGCCSAARTATCRPGLGE